MSAGQKEPVAAPQIGKPPYGNARAFDAPQSLRDSSAQLRVAAASMSKSMTRMGVVEDEPLGLMMGSFHDMVVAFSDASAGTAERIASVIQNTRDLSISEVHRLQHAVALAEQTTQSLRAAEALVKTKSDEALSKLIVSMRPELLRELAKITVIREKHWNFRQNLLGVAATSGLLLGLFAIGYIMGGGDFQSRREGESAKAAVGRCLAAAKPLPLGPASVCTIADLLGKSG